MHVLRALDKSGKMANISGIYVLSPIQGTGELFSWGVHTLHLLRELDSVNQTSYHHLRNRMIESVLVQTSYQDRCRIAYSITGMNVVLVIQIVGPSALVHLIVTY